MATARRKKCRHCGYIGLRLEFFWHGRSTGKYCPICFVRRRNEMECQRRLRMKHDERVLKLTEAQIEYLHELVINEVPDIVNYANEMKIYNQLKDTKNENGFRDQQANNQVDE